MGSKADRDFSFLKMLDEELDEGEEMLGKRAPKPVDSSELESEMNAKKIFYEETMKQASDQIKNKAVFRENMN